MKRRSFLATTSASAAAFAPGAGAAVPPQVVASAPATVPITGQPVPELAAFDRAMVGFLGRWTIPGGQCAVAKDGRLVYARGFGYGNAPGPGALPALVSPTARFRIASCSKPITAVTILRLVEQGRLTLDERAFDILHDLTPPPGTTVDPRLQTITVRHLLEHSGGFVYPDASGFDPQFDGLRLAADAFGHARPASPTDIIRFALGRPLGFTPGTGYVYSNLGYNILGRIIERRTALAFGPAVQSLTLDPIGVHGIALMTRTSPQARLPDEVFYVDGDQYIPQYPVYEDDPVVRPYSYGGFDGRAIDAHGGGIANAPDLTRFLDAVAGAGGVQLLRPQTVALMLARPAIPSQPKTGPYYALGWDVRPGTTILSHAGAITFGTFSVVFRLPGGITYAALFNHLDADIRTMGLGIEAGLIAAAQSIRHWPANDLYPTDRAARKHIR